MQGPRDADQGNARLGSRRSGTATQRWRNYEVRTELRRRCSFSNRGIKSWAIGTTLSYF